MHNRNIVNSMVHNDDTNSDNNMPMVDAIKKFDFHFNEENYYYPFRITHWSDIDKCKMSSFFMSFHDESRYQAADRSGTFVGNPTCNTLVYEDFDEYQHRYTLRQAKIGLDDQHRVPWHEQLTRQYIKGFHSFLGQGVSVKVIIKVDQQVSRVVVLIWQILVGEECL